MEIYIIVVKNVAKMVALGIDIISVADTVGLATPMQISTILKAIIPQNKLVEIGVHLHSTADSWQPKLFAAINEGCNRYDGALKGIGDCPMANNKLVGNLDTEMMISYFKTLGLPASLNLDELSVCSSMASKIFL